MPVWEIEPISERPNVTLTGWQVFDVPLFGLDKPWTRHLVGWSCEDRQGQASSPVQTFDPATGRFATRSGRIYRVVGAPGMGADAKYVWNRFKARDKVVDFADVTNEVRSALLSAPPNQPHEFISPN